jgi:hypothetical protein
MTIIESKYEIGQIIYLKTDIDQKQRIVTGIIVRSQSILYELSCGTETSGHYDFEITTEQNIEIKVL